MKNENENENEFCKYCRWFPELPESHIEHSSYCGCKYIDSKYDKKINEDGEIEYKLKITKLSQKEMRKQMKKEMAKLEDWVCIGCGWLEDYNVTHRNFCDGDCPKIRKR